MNHLLSIILYTLFAILGFYKENNNYRINYIRDKGEFLIIHASCNNKRYLIVSEKDSQNSSGKKIVIGRKYHLELTRLLPLESVDGVPVMLNYGVIGLSYYGKTVITSRKYHYSIYHADNLRGKNICDNP